MVFFRFALGFFAKSRSIYLDFFAGVFRFAPKNIHVHLNGALEILVLMGVLVVFVTKCGKKLDAK